MKCSLKMRPSGWAWNRELIDVEHIPAQRTAVLAADGEVLTIGPWIAGNYDLRLCYSDPVPTGAGRIKGKFRTEGLYPREANLWLTYYNKGRKVTELNFWFGETESWTEFSFPVFAPPAGCDSIRLSFGFHMKTHGRLLLRNLAFGEPEPLSRQEGEVPVPYRKMPEKKFATDNFVRLHKTEAGTWWLSAPDGTPFYSAGCAMYNNHLTPPETFRTLEKIGFNTIANGSDLQAWRDFNEDRAESGMSNVYQFYRVNTDISLRSGYVGLMDRYEAVAHEDPAEKMAAIGGFNHAFPDPFDPEWEKDVRRQVKEVSAIFHDAPYFMGWMGANERSHWNLYRYVWSPYCAKEFEKYLRNKYASISELNAAWATEYRDFEQLLSERPEPLVIEGNKYEDFRLFSRYVLSTFNKKVLSIIREEDPDRLVFTNRFMIHEVRGVFENLDLYKDFDGIAVNIYPSNDCWGLDMAERQYLERMHQETGKPLIICEWSVPALDSGLYDDPDKLDWSYPQVVQNQQERARQAACVAAELYNLPFVVGAHWFSWGDFQHKTRASNRGLYHSDGITPWNEVQESLEAIYGNLNK